MSRVTKCFSWQMKGGWSFWSLVGKLWAKSVLWSWKSELRPRLLRPSIRRRSLSIRIFGSVKRSTSSAVTFSNLKTSSKSRVNKCRSIQRKSVFMMGVITTIDSRFWVSGSSKASARRAGRGILFSRTWFWQISSAGT